MLIANLLYAMRPNVNRTDSEGPDSVVDEFLRLGLDQFLLQGGGAVARQDHDVSDVQPVSALCNIKSKRLCSLLSHILHLIGSEHLKGLFTLNVFQPVLLKRPVFV